MGSISEAVAQSSTINHFGWPVNYSIGNRVGELKATFFTYALNFDFQLLNSVFIIITTVKIMNLVAILLSFFILGLLIMLILQMRRQRLATEELLSDNRIRTRLYQDADESTTFILSRTIQNISAGHPDPNLESDSFALKVVRELVKRRVSK